jgi:hypothetical protein
MKALGRALADFKLSEPEKKLVACARLGEEWKASDLEASALRAGVKEYEISGELVRFLALGGDDSAPVHENGLRIRGAYVTSGLDFTGSSDVRFLSLKNCFIQGSIQLEVATTSSIYLDGCSVQRIVGNRAQINGTLYMRFGFVAREGLDISGSHVSGSISCRGGTFLAGPTSPDEPISYCFRIDDAEILGTLILGPRQNDDRKASGKERAVRNRTELRGRVSLQGTTCAALFDGAATYEQVDAGMLRIHGFRYGRLAGIDATKAEFRLSWLAKAQRDAEFSPQTYEYLASVLREMGHEEDARRIFIERHRVRHQLAQERRADDAKVAGQLRRMGLSVTSAIASTWNWLFDTLVRYGYEPWRAIVWSFLPLAAGALIFANAYGSGDMVPANPIMALKEEWKECRNQLREESRKAPFPATVVNQPRCAAFSEYPAFNAIWYSFDVFVPILSVHQEDFWTPGPRSPLVRHYLAFHTIFGWLFVTLGLSSMIGLVQRRAAPGGK